MSVTLHVSLNTPAKDLDPGTALLDMRTVLGLLRDMDAAEARADEYQATAWRFQAVQVGSLQAAFTTAENTPLVRERAAGAGLRLIHGYQAAETDPVIPDAWGLTSARKATNIANHLDD